MSCRSISRQRGFGMTRVGVFGWGIVAPKSPDIKSFQKNLSTSDSWLTPFHGFGPDNFLVGTPEFRFEDYQAWIDQRFAPRHFHNLKEKMDHPSLYAIGSFKIGRAACRERGGCGVGGGGGG